MNKIEEQILKNQKVILKFLNTNNFNNPYYDECIIRVNETNLLLNPVKEPSLAEQTKDAFSEEVVA